MVRRVLIFFILVTHAVSDYCERYTFEQNFEEWLTHEWGGACVAMPFWIVGKYSDLDLTGQNERSTSFITPLPSPSVLPEMSCVSSYIFSMNVGGTIEVNIYIDPTDPNDQVIVIANLLDITGGDRVTGMETHSASNPSFMRGWRTLTMTLTGSDTYDGYISIMGMAAPESIVLVDSFRYIPPGMDESECQLYEEITTPDPTTVATPDPITTPIPDEITTPIPDVITTPIPDAITTPVPDPITTPSPDPITTPIPDAITTPIPDVITTPIPDAITTPVPDPITTPSPDPSTTPIPDAITTPIPDAITTPIPDAITTPTPDSTTTATTTSMDTENDSDDTGAPTSYPCPTPPMDNEETKGFWTPLTITMLVLLYLIVFALVCLLFYEIGRRRAKAAAAEDNFDFESLPSSFKVPRVKTVYPDANTNPYARRNSW